MLIVSHSSGDGNVEFRNIFSECVGKKTKVSASSSGLYLTKLPSGNLTLQRDPFFWIVSLTNEDDGMDVELRDPLKREMPGVCAEDDGTAAATCRHGTIDAGHGNTVCIGCHTYLHVIKSGEGNTAALRSWHYGTVLAVMRQPDRAVRFIDENRVKEDAISSEWAASCAE